MHFQVVKKGAKWGQNANYQQFHYGIAIYSLQNEQNRNRYTWTVWNEKYSLLG